MSPSSMAEAVPLEGAPSAAPLPAAAQDEEQIVESVHHPSHGQVLLRIRDFHLHILYPLITGKKFRLSHGCGHFPCQLVER